MEFELLVLDGPDEGQLVRMDRTIHIGRESVCEVQLNDSYVEGYHVRIDIAGPRLFARNLQPDSKTLVNGMKIDEVELNNGDVLSVGATTLRVSFYQPPKSQPKSSPKPKAASKPKSKPKTDKKRKAPTRAASEPRQRERQPEPIEHHPEQDVEVPAQGGNPGLAMILVGFILLLAFIIYCFAMEKKMIGNSGESSQSAIPALTHNC